MECDIVDYSVYGNEADVRSDELLREALESEGVRARIVQLAREGIAAVLAERIWLRYDLRSFDDLFLVAGVARDLEQSGHRVFPRPISIRQSEDKWESFLALRACGVPTVDTFLLGEAERYERRCVLKPRVGWGGMGMKIVVPGMLQDNLLPGSGGDYVWQPFVDHGHTWTVALTGNEGAVLLQKRARFDDFRTNSEFGEEAELADDPGGLCLLGRRALDAVGLVAGTVDLMEMEGRVVALEVNSAPCLWYDQLPGLDLAGPMCRTVMEWFAERSV